MATSEPQLQQLQRLGRPRKGEYVLVTPYGDTKAVVTDLDPLEYLHQRWDGGTERTFFAYDQRRGYPNEFSRTPFYSISTLDIGEPNSMLTYIATASPILGKTIMHGEMLISKHEGLFHLKIDESDLATMLEYVNAELIKKHKYYRSDATVIASLVSFAAGVLGTIAWWLIITY